MMVLSSIGGSYLIPIHGVRRTAQGCFSRLEHKRALDNRHQRRRETRRHSWTGRRRPPRAEARDNGFKRTTHVTRGTAPCRGVERRGRAAARKACEAFAGQICAPSGHYEELGKHAARWLNGCASYGHWRCGTGLLDSKDGGQWLQRSQLLARQDAHIDDDDRLPSLTVAYSYHAP
jgi:hypothetical protein